MLYLLLGGVNSKQNRVMHNFEEFLRAYRLLPRETKALLPATNEGFLQKLRKY